MVIRVFQKLDEVENVVNFGIKCFQKVKSYKSENS